VIVRYAAGTLGLATAGGVGAAAIARLVHENDDWLMFNAVCWKLVSRCSGCMKTGYAGFATHVNFNLAGSPPAVVTRLRTTTSACRRDLFMMSYLGSAASCCIAL
jgi:hypothetical protein